MRRLPDLPPPEFIARDRWYTLLPKRSLGKVVALLILLAGVIYFRARAGRVVGLLGQSAGVAPSSASSRPGGAGAPHQSVPSSPP